MFWKWVNLLLGQRLINHCTFRHQFLRQTQLTLFWHGLKQSTGWKWFGYAIYNLLSFLGMGQYVCIYIYVCTAPPSTSPRAGCHLYRKIFLLTCIIWLRWWSDPVFRDCSSVCTGVFISWNAAWLIKKWAPAKLQRFICCHVSLADMNRVAGTLFPKSSDN